MRGQHWRTRKVSLSTGKQAPLEDGKEINVYLFPWNCCPLWLISSTANTRGQTGAKKAKILCGNIYITSAYACTCDWLLLWECCKDFHTSCKVGALIPFHWISGFIRISLILGLFAARIVLWAAWCCPSADTRVTSVKFLCGGTYTILRYIKNKNVHVP